MRIEIGPIGIEVTCGDEATAGAVLAAIQALSRKVDEFMASVADDLKALKKAMDDETNTIAARIDRLLQGLKNSMTDQELADVKAGFQGEIARLHTMGQDPADPIPPVPPELAAARKK